jgi:hypothetical protein
MMGCEAAGEKLGDWGGLPVGLGELPTSWATAMMAKALEEEAASA